MTKHDPAPVLAPAVVFANPGEIDPRAFTTLGLHAKPESHGSPIGYFGTGLKYAIATCLRLGQEVEIWSGVVRYVFKIEPDEFRGEPVDTIWYRATQTITMPSFSDPSHTVSRDRGSPWTELGYTTALGKNWPLTAAYREFHSNCIDEGGQGGATEPTREAYGGPGVTMVWVRGERFARTHARRHAEGLLIDPTRALMVSTPEIDIHAGRSPALFYRGIAVYTPPRPFAFTYNIKSDLKLTEDRTLDGTWNADRAIARALCLAAPEHVVLDALATGKTYESESMTIWNIGEPSNAFMSAIGMALKLGRPVSTDAAQVFYSNRGGRLQFGEVPFTSAQERALAMAIDLCEAHGFSVRDFPCVLSNELPDGIIAMAENGRCYLAPAAFADQDLLVRALVEEWVHLTHRVRDATRDMQNVLIGHLLRLMGIAPAKAPPTALASALDDEVPF
jgi:hypothetical protein